MAGHNGSTRRRLMGGAFAFLALAGGSAIARAEESCAAQVAPDGSAAWRPPLDRRVTLEARETSLRDALGRLATAGRVRLSFAADLLPLSQRVCAGFTDTPLGDALVALLRGTILQPVPVGGNQVALAPAAKVVDGRATTLSHRDTLTHLTPVVVSGTAGSTAARGSTVSADVVSSASLAVRDANSLSEALDGSVPGIWMWEQSPSSVVARYGSIRGASSLGLSSPKVYIDGIEVASASLMHDLQPENIERIEIIRGPQGSVLYGVDAISGVINIITRHDGTSADGRHLRGRSQMGVSTSDYAPFGVLASDHYLSVRAGSPLRSAGASASYSSLGAYIPGALNHQFALTGDMQLVGRRTSITALARLFGETAGTPVSPLFPSTLVNAAFPFGPVVAERGGDRERTTPVGATTSGLTLSGQQDLKQYTLGTTGMFMPGGRWTHTMVLGVDGYRLATAALPGPLRLASDSAALAAPARVDRGSLRLRSSAAFGTEAGTATVTFGAEQSLLREVAGVDRIDGSSDVATPLLRGSSGLFAQVDASVHRSLYLTAGLRGEHVSGYSGGNESMLLPMLGAAVTRDAGPVTLKVHTAYGKGFRPPRALLWADPWSGGHQRLVVSPDLEPEVQSGIEAGVSLWVGNLISLRATRFDQRASGLIQAVPQGAAVPSGPHGVESFELQNVGVVDNEGWEVQGSLSWRALSLAATFSTVDSRVLHLASAYTGDLAEGDRMLGVPARTASITATWTGRRWSTSWSLVGAADWVNYDYLGMAQATAAASSGTTASGAATSLRGYWLDYPGVTRLRGSLTRELFKGVSLLLTGDNLLGRQTGEPDNLTVVPGRRFSLGLRF